MSSNPPAGVESRALSKLPRGAWLIVGLLTVVACLNYLDRIMLTTMRESVKASIAMSDAQFGLLTSVFLWVYGGLSPFAGFLADRVSRARLIMGSLLVWSLTTWLTSHAVTFEQLLMTRIVMGISEACYLPAALALITEYHRGPTRSLAVGIHLCGVSIGSGLGGMGGWLAERHGWAYAFAVFGLFGIVYSFFLIFLLRDAPKEPRAAGDEAVPPRVDFLETLQTLFRTGSYRILLVVWGLMGLAGWGVIGWMPTYMQQTYSLSQGQAGLVTTGFLQLSTLVGCVLGGMWSDRWSRNAPRGRQYVAVIGMSIAAPAIFLAVSTPLLALAMAGLFVFGFGRACADGNIMPILCTITDARYRATAFGILNLFACFIGGVSIYLGGVLRDANINVRHMFEFSAAMLVLCAVLLWVIKPNKKFVE